MPWFEKEHPGIDRLIRSPKVQAKRRGKLSPLKVVTVSVFRERGQVTLAGSQCQCFYSVMLPGKQGESRQVPGVDYKSGNAERPGTADFSP